MLSREEQKAKKAEYNKKWREANKEKARESFKKWYDSNKGEYYEDNRERLNEYRRAYRAENRDRVSEWKKRQYAKNPEPTLAVNRRYQHSKKNPDLTADEFNMVECFYEQAARLNNIFWGQVFEVDHTIPLSKGGEHCPSNLQVVPRKWNRTKSNYNSKRWKAPFTTYALAE